MKFILAVILVLIAPYGNLSLPQGSGQSASSARDHFVFPKDRIDDGPDTRIIGGQEVTPHKYPSQVALYIYVGQQIFFCGGSLIKPDWVLTAAHCLDNKPNYVVVYLGSHNVGLGTTEPTRVTMNATRYVIHKDWDATLLRNDVALVKLPRNVTLDANIRTVSYAGGNSTYASNSATIVGWGKTSDTGDLARGLREVNTTVMTNAACKAIFPFETIILDSHICTSGDGIIGSCNGDSGGPLFVNGIQVGIVSFGYTNCTMGKPSAFTRVTYFHDWIEQHAVDGTAHIGVSLVLSTIVSLVYLFNSI